MMNDALEYWEDIFASRPWGKYPPEELIRFVARNFGAVDDRASVRALEVGCGPGPNVWYLVREGYSVAGIDGSTSAIRTAMERLQTENLRTEPPHVDLRVGNFVSLPWPDESFDLAVDIEALYANRMSDISAAVSEIRRCLKPGGLFFGKMFGNQTTGSDSGAKIEPGTRAHPVTGPCAGNEIAHFFSQEDILRLFNGFSALDVDHSVRTDQNGVIRTFEWLVTARK